MRVPWKVVAIGAIVTTISLAAALVIVGALKDADLLATTALALAILAFTIQIVVYIAQSVSASDQAVRGENLHASTRELLAEVREQSSEVRSTVRGLADRKEEALRAAVTEAKHGSPSTDVPERALDFYEESPAAADEYYDDGDEDDDLPPDLEAKITRRRRAMHPSRRKSTDPIDQYFQREAWSLEQRVELGSAVMAPLDLDQLVAELDELSALETSLLMRYGRDEVQSSRVGLPPGLVANPKSIVTQALLDHGLVEYVTETNKEGDRIARLTSRGRDAAMLLLQTEDRQLPGWLQAAFDRRHQPAPDDGKAAEPQSLSRSRAQAKRGRRASGDEA